MAEIRINATGGVKLYDADDSHYAQIIAGTITSNVNAITLGHNIATFNAAITAGGIIKTDDTTAATSTTDGSLQTDGGLSVALDGVIGDDLLMLSDASVIHFGADSEVTLTHSADVGLNLKHTATADDKPIVLTLQTGETDMAADDVIGKIAFQAPDEGTGTDAILVSGAIQAVAEGNHSSSSNATRLEFMTGASEAATTKMSVSSGGNVAFNSGFGSVTTVYGCRAWVNFNGEDTLAIRDSGNVSSVTDNATGNYNVNFATSMPDVNFVGCSGGGAITSTANQTFYNITMALPDAVDSHNIQTRLVDNDAASFASSDTDIVQVAYFR